MQSKKEKQFILMIPLDFHPQTKDNDCNETYWIDAEENSIGIKLIQILWKRERENAWMKFTTFERAEQAQHNSY